jgi:hypothetical protein
MEASMKWEDIYPWGVQARPRLAGLQGEGGAICGDRLDRSFLSPSVNRHCCWNLTVFPSYQDTG